MEIPFEARVIAAERLGSGVFIEFADGKSALFPASFLSAHQPWYEIDLVPDPGEMSQEH